MLQQHPRHNYTAVRKQKASKDSKKQTLTSGSGNAASWTKAEQLPHYWHTHRKAVWNTPKEFQHHWRLTNYKVRFIPTTQKKELFRKEEVSLHSSPFKIFFVLGEDTLTWGDLSDTSLDAYTGRLTNRSVFVFKKVKKFNTDLIFIPRSMTSQM